MPQKIHLAYSQHIASTDHTQHLLIWEPEYFIWSEQAPFALPLSMTILGNHLGYGKGLTDCHSGVHLHGHITASGGKILGGHIIGTAQHKLDIRVADNLAPKVLRISVLKLT